MAAKVKAAATTDVSLADLEDARMHAQECAARVGQFPQRIEDLSAAALLDRDAKGQRGRRRRASAFDAGSLADAMADVADVWETAVGAYRRVADVLRRGANVADHRRFDPPFGYATYHAAAIDSWNVVWRIMLDLAESPAWHGPVSISFGKAKGKAASLSAYARHCPAPENYALSRAIVEAVYADCAEPRSNDAAPKVRNLGDAIRGQRGQFNAALVLSFADATRAAVEQGRFRDPYEMTVGIDLEFDLACEMVGDRPANVDSPSTNDATTGDGPAGLSGFRWQDDLHEGMRAQVFRLVCYLWRQKDRAAYADELAEVLHKDHSEDVGPNTIHGCRRDANAFFAEHRLPWKLAVTDGGRRVALLPLGDR